MVQFDSIRDLSEFRQKLHIQEELLIQKAFQSGDINEIYTAQKYIASQIQQKDDIPSRAMLLDPLEVTRSLGYRNKRFTISYDMLRAMGKTDIVKAIIETRKDQIKAFCTPQKDKYSTGFIVQKKEKYQLNKEEKKLTKEEEKKIEYITNFILECGTNENFWDGDDFDTFIGKIVDDSLTLDQGTFEVVRDRSGNPVQFLATDGATFRLADSYEDEYSKGEKFIKGYPPSYVQLYQGKIMAEFYPWELGFCVRNPKTDIKLNGYGTSELEDMIQTVTAILNAGTYNANFFKVGSSPKGILKYSGNINPSTVEDFRRQWTQQLSGVQGMHKIPIINADKLDFINTHVNNKDMEFMKYVEFLIKIACALFKIDPSEINFPMSGSADSKPMFEGNNEARLKYSRDKGLKPLLKSIQGWLNKWIVSQIDKDYELRFVGIESEKGEKDELDLDIQKLSNFQTVNEIRKKYNLKEVEGGDTILNPTYVQAKMQASMMAGGGDEGANAQIDGMYGEQEEEDTNPFSSNSEQNNPFIKSLLEDTSLLR